MPADVEQALRARALMDAYQALPLHKRNDYVGRITSARRPEIRERRLRQMLDELARGGVTARMGHKPSERR